MKPTSSSMTPFVILIGFALGCVGCGDEKIGSAVDDVPIPVAPAARQPQAAETAHGLSFPHGKPAGQAAAGAVINTGPFEKTLPGIRFSVSEGWKEIELSSQEKQMRITNARFLIPAADEEVGLTFSFVGGGIDGNVKRWEGQFQLPAGEVPRVETIRVSGLEATWVDLRGTFQARVGENPGPHPNWRMIGVAVPMKPRDLYLKLTGPREAVAEVSAAFRTFVAGARLTE